MGDMWKYTLALAVILTIFLIAYFVAKLARKLGTSVPRGKHRGAFQISKQAF